jgi:methylmalonyl-CoA/ethylmalonyl-CoA epimerase
MTDRISHIGVVVRDLESALIQWSQLGFREVRRLEVPQEAARSVFLTLDEEKGGFLVELVQPTDTENPDSPIARRLQRHGEGMLHMAIVTPDIEAARAKLDSAEIRYAVREGVSEPRDPRLIVSPRAANGIMIEYLTPRKGK